MAFTLVACDGFETQGFERYVTVSNTTFMSADVRTNCHGTRSVEMGHGTNQTLEADPYEFQGSPNSNAKVIGYWIKHVSGSGYFHYLLGYTSSTTVKFRLAITTTNNSIYLQNSAYTSISNNTSTGIADGDWHFLELWYQDGTDSASWELFLDGTSLDSGTGASFLAGTTDRIRFQGVTSLNYSRIDDWYFGEATAASDRLGDCDIFAVTGSTYVYGFFDASDGATSGTNWSNWANATQGWDASGAYAFVLDPNTNTLNFYGTNVPSSGATITAVDVAVKCSVSSTTIYPTYDLVIYSDGQAETLLTQSNISTSLTPAFSSWYTVSAPTGGWTWADVAALEGTLNPDYGTGGVGADTYRVYSIIVRVTTSATAGTTGGDTLDYGTWQNVQEIPYSSANNYAYYSAFAGGSDTERAAPDTIAVQTNLTGSVTDIDDDPDTPDGNWLTASGSSTLRVTFPTPTGDPTTGAGVQNFRVLLRKNATGPTQSNDRLAPDTIATQTNLTGSVTDIDDDPDSPDANWLTASGSSTLRVTFPTPTYNPTTGAGQQEFRVLMRKNATGPAGGGGTEDVTPDSLITQTGLTGAVTLIDDDPDSPDGDTNWTGDNGWMTSTASNSVLVVSMTDPTNGGDIDDTTDAQVIKVFLRKDATGGGDPTFTLAVYDGATLHETLATDVSVTTAGTLFSYNWTSSGLSSPNNVRVSLTCTKGGGGPNERNIEVDAVRWEMAYSTGGETQPGYSIQLYENGSQVVAVTPATGTLTDAGGDTVANLTWDATELGTADGSLVECYITQTSGADRYIEFGAVEWNCLNGAGETQPGYSVQLYENGSQVVAVTPTTGTLTDAGGDTVVQLSWDATELGTADGSLVECYVTQTSGSDRYIEVGAVEWNVTYDLVDAGDSGWVQSDGTGVYVGPSGMTGISSIVGMCTFISTLYTGTGSQYTHSLLRGNNTDGTSELSLGNATATASTFFDITQSASIVPTTSEYARVGFGRTSGTDVTIRCIEVLAQLLVLPEVGLGVTGVTEVITVTENNATVNKERGVSCSPEVVTATENNATVSTGVSVTCTPEAVTVTENNATVSIALNVACTPESVTVTENAATVNQSRDVYAVGASPIGYVNTYVSNPGGWTDPANAYDGSTSTYAYSTSSGQLRLSNCSTPVITGKLLGAEMRAYVQAVGHSGDPFIIPWVTPETIAQLNIDSEYATAKWTPWVTASEPVLGWDYGDWLHLASVRPGWGATSSGEFRVYKIELRGYYAEAVSVATNTASLNVTRNALAATEAVTVTENNASLNITRNVSGVTEVVTATENNASVTRGIAVTGVTEAVTVTENDATVNAGRGILASTELVTVTENDASLNIARGVTGVTEVVTVTENPAAVNRSRPVTGITEIVTVTENPATVNQSRGVSGATEVVTVVENNATVNVARGVTGVTETVTVTENDASLNVERGVIGLTEVVTVIENTASIGGALFIAATTEAVTVTENNASLNVARGVNASTEVVAVTENNAVVNKPKAVSGVTEIVTVTENNAAIGRSRGVTGITEVVSVTENPATVNLARGVTGASESVTLTENNASLSVSRGVTGATEIITVTENDAVVSAGAVQWIVTGVTETINVSANSATIVYFLRHVPSQDAGWVQITSGADVWNNITPSQTGGWVQITPDEPDDWAEGSIIN